MASERKSVSISEKIYDIAKPIAQNLGLEVWDVKFLKEGQNWYLRVFIDKPQGISIEDCEKMSHGLDEPLDILDPIEQSYFLEVCSPGIERELSKDSHLEKFIGYQITVKLIRPNENGEKFLLGKLVKFDKCSIIIELSDKCTIEIPRKNISRINLKMLKEN